MAQPMMDQPMISTRLATALEQLEQDPGAALERMDTLYSETMTFVDPLQIAPVKRARLSMRRTVSHGEERRV